MKEKIIIFGGSGFIGSNLINKIKNLNYDITSVSRKKILNKKKYRNIRYISCDVSNFQSLKKIKSNYDYIINLSGNIDHQNKIETFKAHYTGCKNLIKFFKNKSFKKFIQIGSSLEYGNLKSPHLEKKKTFPKSHYGKAKAKANKILIKNFKRNKSLIILRLYQIYGPKQKLNRLIPYAIKSSLKDKKFDCTSGNQYRDFLYIDDLTNLFLKILRNKKIITGIFNVGSGKPLKVKNIIQEITNITKKGKPIFGAIKMRKEESKVFFPNIQKIKLTFRWKPTIGILEGLRKTIKFYEKN